MMIIPVENQYFRFVNTFIFKPLLRINRGNCRVAVVTESLLFAFIDRMVSRRAQRAECVANFPIHYCINRTQRSCHGKFCRFRRISAVGDSGKNHLVTGIQGNAQTHAKVAPFRIIAGNSSAQPMLLKMNLVLRVIRKAVTGFTLIMHLNLQTFGLRMKQIPMFMQLVKLL